MGVLGDIPVSVDVSRSEEKPEDVKAIVTSSEPHLEISGSIFDLSSRITLNPRGIGASARGVTTLTLEATSTWVDKRPPIKAEVICFSACSDGQNAWEHPGKRGGALIQAFVEGIKTLAVENDKIGILSSLSLLPSHRELLAFIEESLECQHKPEFFSEGGKPQTVELWSAAAVDPDAPIII